MLHKRGSEALVAYKNSDKSISSDLASSPSKRRRLDITDSTASDKSSIVASGSSSSGFKGDSFVQQHEMAMGNSNRLEIDEDLHIRQLTVYGRETMRCLFALNVFISGMHGLRAEFGSGGAYDRACGSDSEVYGRNDIEFGVFVLEHILKEGDEGELSEWMNYYACLSVSLNQRF